LPQGTKDGIILDKKENGMSEVNATISLPPRLAKQVQDYVQAGWFPNLNDLIIEALRRYLEAHQMELSEHFIWQDVEWGLSGDD
jgi:hypothetical protein